METLYLLKYNNYYNRIVKKENTLEDYIQYTAGPFLTVNFNPNDYIDTTQIINWNFDEPDYVIVTDESSNILSRWFVVAAERTRARQLQLTLHRDTVVDFYDPIVNADCFIEKAIVQDNDPAIFNAEDMTFNQILTSSTPLMDETQSPWLVGYMAKDKAIENLDIDYETDLVADYPAVSSISDLPFAEYLDKPYTNFSDVQINLLSQNNDDTVFINSFNKYGTANPPAHSTNIEPVDGFTFITTGSKNREGYYAETLQQGQQSTLIGQFVGNVPAARHFTQYIQSQIPSTSWN